MEENNASNEPTQKRQKRRPGGQPGNKNGLKHGFYSSSLTAAERKKLLEAKRVTGLRNELDFLRVKLFSLGSHPQVTLSHLAAAAHAIARLAEQDRRTTATEREGEDLENNIENVLNSIGRALGLDEFRSDEAREGREGEGVGEGEAG